MKQQPKVPVPVGKFFARPFFAPRRAHPVVRLFALAVVASALVAGGGCRGKQREAKVSGEQPPLPLQTFARQWATDLKLGRDPLRTIHVRDDTIYAFTRGGRAVSLARDSGSIQFSRPIKGGGTLLHAPVVMNEKLTIRTAREDVIVTPVIFPTATTIEILEKVTGRVFFRLDSLGD